ncbi:Adaptor protein complex protein 4B [Hibiscus trionum]|uniref:Beta-adaptin-like protein n=1 Tax=Hibiscus trionum TaxID=183268 RepID=A0A9W7JLP0_HIBTR|nr:Adaptor protein complex protein 4B [Hibiscus trionum]
MPPPAQSQRSPSPSQPSGKSEVSDLKFQLRQLAGSRAPGVDDSKRELFKKVISYMTIGIDVSSLFGEMVMCSATSDVVLKKMCYLYVGNYAKVNPDLALLTINFLQKDCRDEDPMIRGLALRSLSSLCVANLVEYLVGPLGSGLKDGNAYVRMVAVIGVLKLYQFSASTCIDADFPSILKHLMLNDSDTHVVANCLSALQEIWSAEASTSEEALREREALISKPIIYYLLNRIKEFSEWAQCLVLELVTKYAPSDSSEAFDIMNLLEDRLQHANGAVVLATSKVFLQLTLSITDVHHQVYERIKAPMLTLVSSGSPEQSYAVLSHLHLLVMRAPYIFSSDYKHFYCHYNEPSYVKRLKLEMLTAVANESNTYEIVTELCEYAANVDIPIARESIRAVGKIALQQYDVNAIVDRLLQFLEMEKDYVTAEALVLVKDLLRKYPQWSQDCIAVVGNISSKTVREPKAKAALIWMLGEYSQEMQDAPYVLENLVENWAEEHSAEVRLHLLTAVMKCFFKRPPETQNALGAALAAGVADFHQDVHDRALFYYRMLQHNVSVAERVVNPPKQAVSVFADTQSSEIKDRIFDEFNSLSVVYQKPSYMFTDREHRGTFEFSDELGNLSIGGEVSENVVSAQRVDENDNHLLLTTSEKEEASGSSNNGSAYVSPYDNSSASASAVASQTRTEPAISNPTATGHSSQSASLGIDDLLDLGLPAALPAPASPQLKLNAEVALDPSTFQQKWRQLPVSLSQEYSVSPRGVAALTAPQALIRHMQSHSIHCIASGGQSPSFKFFFFAQKMDSSSNYLVECIINTSSAFARITIKADDQSTSEVFSTLFQSALSKFGNP